jgi:serine/threonine-protein kinase
VLVAKLENRGMLTRFVRAALLHEIAHVPLAQAPRGAGAHTLQLRLGPGPAVLLSAEPVGTGAGDAFPLRLRPLDPTHVPELKAILAEEIPVPVSGAIGPPLSASGSAIFDEHPPLPSAGNRRQRRETRPLPAHRPPLESITVPNPGQTPPSSNDRSVMFDPEQALISRAPARPAGTGPEDTLTVPGIRGSAYPGPSEKMPSTPPMHAPAPLVAPDAKITAKSNTGLAVEPDASNTGVSHTAPMVSSPKASPSRLPPPAIVDGGRGRSASEVSLVVEFDTSASNVATQRNGTEADAIDASIGGSVVIDMDVMAREQRTSASTPVDSESPADGESISVIFGDEKTTPDVTSQSPALNAVMKTATKAAAPVAVATGRRPSGSVRVVEDDDEVDDDADTLLRDSARPVARSPIEPAVARPAIEPVIESRALKKPDSAEAGMTSSTRRGPPTQKRTMVDVVAGRTIANKYRIQSLVGSGAVGAVYKAAHTELERTVAIKVLHPHYRQDRHLMAQFRAEARAASLLHHPNVTVVHDFGEEPDGLVYIVMEYLQGWTLQTVLDEERRLAPRRAVNIMLQVCAALATAHERGIVHRDVKPDNIILIPTRDDDGRPAEVVKVCDFGIAALESAPTEEDEFTAGTPEYMAPEQAGGRADARTDVYACGIVLYEMVTGAAPFVADTPVATLKKHATDPVRRPTDVAPDVPPALEAVIMRALEKPPERRWQTARELRAELKKLLG